MTGERQTRIGVGDIVLRVLGGPQRGAHAALSRQQSLSIGSGLDNDVVLRDPACAGMHMILRIDEDDQVAIDVLGASMFCGETACSAGESHTCDFGTVMSLGNSSLVVEALIDTEAPHGVAAAPAPAKATGDVDPAFSPVDPVSGDQALPVRATVQAASPDAQNGRPGRALGWAAAAVAVLCVALAMVMGRAPVAREDGGGAVVQALLERFPGVTLEESVVPARVVGYLASRSDAKRLDDWLEDSGTMWRDATVVSEVLGERVLDVFRLNGVDAQLESVDGGAVTVITQVAEPEVLARAQARARGDVAQLASLEVDNRPAPVVSEGERSPPPFLAGKRVALVVADAPAHLVTEDRSRYFEGALLPSGYRIERIEEDSVLLAREGVTTELRF